MAERPIDRQPAAEELASDAGWEDLQRAWQEPPPNGLPDLKKLLRRRSWAIWALTGFDTLFTILLSIWIVWLINRDPSPSVLIYSMFLVLVMGAGWGTVLWIRRGTWHLDTEAPDAMLDLSIRRCRASVKLAVLNQWSIGVSLILGFGARAAARHGLIVIPDSGFRTFSELRIFLILAVIVWFVASHWYKRRKVAELEKLEALREEV